MHHMCIQQGGKDVRCLVHHSPACRRAAAYSADKQQPADYLAMMQLCVLILPNSDCVPVASPMTDVLSVCCSLEQVCRHPTIRHPSAVEPGQACDSAVEAQAIAA